MEFSRQEYWSGLLFPSLVDLPNLGTEPGSLALAENSLLSESSAKPPTVFADVTQLRWALLDSVQFSSVAQSCLTLCDPNACNKPGLPVHHQLPEFTQTHVHRVGDAIQPSHSLLSTSPPAFNLCQHQGLFKWVRSSHQVTKVLEFQLQHQSFLWIFRTDFFNLH